MIQTKAQVEWKQMKKLFKVELGFPAFIEFAMRASA